jgi:hypothetical protein
MEIPLPVYLYDVITTSDPPRVVLTCRSGAAAQGYVGRLTESKAALDLEGDETFTVAPPRVAIVSVPLVPGSRVTSSGYDVAIEAVASILVAANPQPVPAAPAGVAS